MYLDGVATYKAVHCSDIVMGRVNTAATGSCLAVVMPMHKADSEGTPNTAVHLHLHVRGCRCHPGSVSFTWTSHSKFDPL
jgi:hypothetical protein